MEKINALKQDLATYPQEMLNVLRKYYKLPKAPREELLWDIAIREVNQLKSQMPSKPKLYLVAGAPGAGKTTAVRHLQDTGIVPQDIEVIDRDLITEHNIDLAPELHQIHLKYGYDPELEEIKIHRLMTEAFIKTDDIYKKQLLSASRDQRPFLTFIPPFLGSRLREFSEDILKHYKPILIFIDTSPTTAYQRTKSRSQKQPWLRLNTVDVYCSWNLAIESVSQLCQTGKCYVCNNEGKAIKCYPLKEYPHALPTAEQASQLCEREKHRVLHHTSAVLRRSQESESLSEESGY